MTDKEKKILPFMVLTLLSLGAAGIYWMFFYKPVVPYVPQKAEQVSQQLLPPTGESQSIENISKNESAALLSGGATLAEVQNFKTYEYTDSEGNIVQEILEPAPITVDSSNHLLVSDDNKRIMNILRENMLLELQAKNEKLKAAKKLNQLQITGEVVPTNVNGNFIPVPNVDTSGFTELETTKPLLSSASIHDSDISEEFSRITLASLTVTERKGMENEVSAWVRYDKKLFRATVGRKLGDFVIKDINESNISIRYVPANVTKKLGHSGFES
ncbi:hypothetical protein [Vibrio sp. THAF190c]|uniref:hypothetical protein n=1 Tax=Vibrio sp. THAF190c TaxID=2587865 RepID=UPI001267EF4B|nr:hypothetical protein [Vibrio sp. THAF190c]QFT13395.1 hypothetical protein FIV04_25930 [Vibrio sp. THAF190c]